MIKEECFRKCKGYPLKLIYLALVLRKFKFKQISIEVADESE